MCVIIHIPKEQKISEKELESAWKRNKHGAGYMYLKNGKIHYERGFMNLDEYKEAIEPLNGKYDLVLHLRISTSDKVNRVQTHPYELGNVMNQKGVTTNPVICMNGTVKSSDLVMLDECNDTMSYIIENNELFKEFDNSDISVEEKIQLIDFIKDDTSAKWCIMTKEGVFITEGFTKSEGLSFSNLIHRNTFYNSTIKTTYKTKTYHSIYNMKDIVKKSKLRDELYDYDIDLYFDVYDYIEEYCNDCSNTCVGCLKHCKNIKDFNLFVKNNKRKLDAIYDYYQYNDDYVIEYSEDYYDYYDWYDKNDKCNIFDE